jgi:hypothetical protein
VLDVDVDPELRLVKYERRQRHQQPTVLGNAPRSERALAPRAPTGTRGVRGVASSSLVCS